MATIAIISDIHGNFAALEAVVRDLDRQGADGICCLGDTVGYGGSPNQCLDLLRERRAICILGNHDAVAAGLDSAEDFNAVAREAAHWTADTLSPANTTFLRSLPESRVTRHRALLVHGAPDDRDRYLWEDDEMMAEAVALRVAGRAKVCFFGHTHLPSLAGEDFAVDGDEDRHELAAGKGWLINPGSVGQPRDGDPRASYALWRTEPGEIEFRRVVYDISRAQGRIEKAGLPDSLAERLLVGG